MQYDALERLGRLRDSGALSLDEFEAEKRRILEGPPVIDEPSHPLAGRVKASSRRPLMIAAVAFAGLILIAVVALIGRHIGRTSDDATPIDKIAETSTDQSSPDRPVYEISSSVAGLKVAATAVLPTNPDRSSVDEYCADAVLDPQSAAGKLVQQNGWLVTGEATVGRLRAVSFVGSFEPGTSASCFAKHGNVGIFNGETLQAIVYGEDIGAVGQVPNLDRARVWSGTYNYESPLADVSLSGLRLRVAPVAASDRVCPGKMQVPNTFGLPVSRARAALSALGWNPVSYTEATPDGRTQGLRESGVVETEHCVGTGFAACYFEYENEKGARLTLRTLGEDDDPHIVSYDVACSGKEGV